MKPLLIALIVGVLAVMSIILSSILATNELKFRFYVNPKFRGRLVAIEDPDLALDYGRVYRLRQNGNAVKVPRGFLSGKQPVFWRTVATYDLQGSLLSEGDNPPDGKVGIRGLVHFSEPGADGTSQERQCFLVSDKYDPVWSGDRRGFK